MSLVGTSEVSEALDELDDVAFDICDGCEECAPELFGVSFDTDDSPLKVPLMEIARG